MGEKRTSRRRFGADGNTGLTVPLVHTNGEGSWEMKIAVIGRGNVGGGLADLWEKAGHEVTRIGKEGGDVSEAEAVLVAVPGGAIEAALDNVQGLEGKTVIDATNLFGTDRPTGFQSNAQFVKSRTNGPTAKSFNLNFARLYDQLDNARSKPGSIWTGDEEAREVVEQLNRDAGYEPLHGGPLENARAQEDFLPVFFGISQQTGPCLYRMAPPGEL
jgi:predicted dinucleotide-binding enzyme